MQLYSLTAHAEARVYALILLLEDIKLMQKSISCQMVVMNTNLVKFFLDVRSNIMCIFASSCCTNKTKLKSSLAHVSPSKNAVSLCLLGLVLLFFHVVMEDIL